MIWDPVKKEKVHQFHVRYMPHHLMKKHGTHRDNVIKMFQLTIKLVALKHTKNELSKKNVSVLSFIMFYKNRNTFMYKVIGALIYAIIYEYTCLDYLGLLQERYPNTMITSKKPRFNDFYGLGIPEILMNIMSYHGFVKSSI